MSNEEASPFGCISINHRDLDEGLIMQPDNTVSILDSPFSSANVIDDMENGPKGRRPQDKAKGQQHQQQSNTSGGPGSSKDVNSTLPSGSGSRAAIDEWACSGVDSGAMNTTSASANGVADILESPFVSACLSQDLKNIEADLAAAAAAAEELANATAAVNISKS